MRKAFSSVTVILLGTALGAEPDTDRARKLLVSENYTVAWGTPRTLPSDAELEVGDGNGHGGTLGWLRFKPGPAGVDVLSVQYDAGRQPYESKWPPDRTPIIVKHARMKPDAYATLLRDLAVVDAAKLKPARQDSISFSSNDFWVYARLAVNKKPLIDLNWGGYEGSLTEAEFAKPKATVRLAREAIRGLDFKPRTLTAEERGWASAKFARDWNRFKGMDFHWWVRERYIVMIGVVGDASALTALQDALNGNPEDRCVYYAINAVTRLTGKDVRDKPVEQMDVVKTRERVLDILRNRK